MVEEGQPKKERLKSLDAFRGLVIAGMIFADDSGSIYGGILDHSPWDGITFADFIMPLFLFIVGVSLVMSFKNSNKTGNRVALFKDALFRAVRLFLLGFFCQGIHFAPTHGTDLQTIRICGILQRIAFGFVVVAFMEVCGVHGYMHLHSCCQSLILYFSLSISLSPRIFHTHHGTTYIYSLLPCLFPFSPINVVLCVRVVCRLHYLCVGPRPRMPVGSGPMINTLGIGGRVLRSCASIALLSCLFLRLHLLIIITFSCFCLLTLMSCPPLSNRRHFFFLCCCCYVFLPIWGLRGGE